MSPRLSRHLLTRSGWAFRTSVFAGRVSNLALLFLLMFWHGAAGFASVGPTKEAIHPCAFSDAGFDASTNVHAIEEYSEAIASLLQQRQFAVLDCVADSVRSSKARFSGGTWKLRKLYAGLEKPQPEHPNGQDWRDHMQLIDEWVAARPNSITARVALAESYISYGWEARGGGFSDTVSNSGWTLFDQRLQKAKAILDLVSTLRYKCPEWYVAMQRVAQGQGWSLSEATAVFERAISFEPGYFYSYRAEATLLLPQWLGSEGSPALFAEQAADRMGGKAGDMLYFQIAQAIICFCNEGEAGHFSWPRLQQGFAAIEEQYGTSLAGLNSLAFMAFKFDDSVVANSAFTRIGNSWDKETWGTEARFEKNKAWAALWAPGETRSRAIRQQALANLQTAEGLSYKKDSDIKFTALEQACLQESREDPSKSEFLVQIGKDGIVQNGWMTRPSALATCLLRRLDASNGKKEKLFLPPPHDEYWVVFDLDPATLNTAAKE